MAKMGKKRKPSGANKNESIEVTMDEHEPIADANRIIELCSIRDDYFFEEDRLDEVEADQTVDSLVNFDILEKPSPLEQRGFYDKPTTVQLSEEDENTLVKLEEIVRIGDYHFLRGGFALLRIWELELYRKYAPSFTAYIEDRFEFTRVRAYQLMTAARVYAYLRKHFEKDKLPKSIAPLLAFKKTPILEIKEVYQRALEHLAEGRKPTADGIKSTIRVIAWERKIKFKRRKALRKNRNRRKRNQMPIYNLKKI